MAPNKQPIGRIKEIFYQAQNIPEGKAREAFLQEACGNNDELRQEVESLLALYEASSDFLRHDASGEELTGDPDQIGQMIGHYRILAKLGEGGFGEVFLAEQTEPFRREVALKIVKLGMDSRSVSARFDTERQALALMHHPGIAQVYDAGTTESGRPYFVMELVAGEPINAYCDRCRLSMPDRIELFRLVCDAVQHAHKKGILHRDLKPSNILVSEENGKPLPKIIDFGVAKSLESRLTEQTLDTLREMFIGTPLYMSPEQLNPGDSDIDARSDIYSLGVILYELVAGATPLEHTTPTSMTMADMRKALCEKDPPRPSKRFQCLGRKTTVIAGRRQIKPPTLEKLLKGDLDWVVMKAIEKERERRYDDVLALSEDLERFLNHRPVSAGAPSLVYRAKKFMRRHSLGTAVTAGIGVTILIGICIMTISFLQITKEPRSLIEQRGWKLEKFYDMGELGSNGFAVRPDGSVLIVNEWGPIPKGLYWAKKGGTWSEAAAFSLGDEYVDPEDAVELPEGIYVTVNGAAGTVYRVPKDGGKPELFCNNRKIDNPYRILVAPETFHGPNVDPGNLLVFDNAGSGRQKTTIWSINRSSGIIRPLIEGNVLNKGFLDGGFAPNGMLYAGVNTHKSDEVSILRISPKGDAKVVFNNFYGLEEEQKVADHPKAVHPVTGEMFFGAHNKIYAFYPGQTSPLPVIFKGARALRWAPDGSKLYFIADQAIWTLSGPGIESQPVSTGHDDFVLPAEQSPSANKKQTPPSGKTITPPPTSGPVRGPDRLTAAKQMTRAAVKGDITAAERLIAVHPDLINSTEGNAYQSTPLHFAAYNGRSEFAAWLLAQNADVHAVNKFGVMPLHDAASQGHKEIVEMLLAMEAPVDVKDSKGKTPLQYASENGHDEVASLLRPPLKAIVEISDPNLSNLCCAHPVAPEIAVITGDGHVRIYNYEGQLVQTLKQHGRIFTAVSYSPDGKLLLVGTHSGAILLWESSTGAWRIAAEGIAGSIDRVAWLNGDHRMVWSSYVNYYGKDSRKLNRDKPAVGVADLAPFNTVWATMAKSRDDFQTLASSPDGKKLAVLEIPDRPRGTFILDAATGEVQSTLYHKGHGSGPLSVCFAPDNQTVAVGYAPFDIILWNADTESLLKILEGHSNWVVSLAFSPDGKLLISGSGDSTARFWSVETGQELGRIRFPGSSTYVHSVGFSPDGKKAYALAEDNSLRIVDVPVP